MASFPRSLKRETWLVRFPNGELEVLTGAALDAAFQSGLVDARTAVRAVSNPVWTTLGEAARFSSRPPPGSWSLAPAEIDNAAVADASGTWRLGQVVDETVFESKTRRTVRAVIGVTGVMAMAAAVVFGGWFGKSATTSFGASEMAVRATMVAPPTPKHVNGDLAEPIHSTERDSPCTRRVAEEHEKRLREEDAIRQWKNAISPRRVAHRHSKMGPAMTRGAVLAPPPGWQDLNGTNRYDPLDGSL